MDVDEVIEMLEFQVSVMEKAQKKGVFKKMAKTLKAFHNDLRDAGFTPEEATQLLSGFKISAK